MAKTKVLRPPGLAVFAGFVLLVALLWWLLLDGAVQRGVEATGESLVGARVELESVDVRATQGSIRMTGLQVANPDAPMTNLVEAGEITVDLMLEPLLRKKVVVQELIVTGVRFNTQRETSGALENPDPEAGRLWREVDAWADQIEVPELSLSSLGGVIRTDAIDADSLRTVQYAREVVQRADSMRSDWESRLTALDPRPRIDSVRSVVQRLEAFNPNPVNALQIPGLLRDGRTALDGVTSLRTEVAALDDVVRQGVASLRIGPDLVDELRTADLAYARSLLDIPSLEAPSISPALFGGTALVWLKPMLYWARTAERFLPPGLDPRNRPGPQRARAEGTTVEFPGRAEYPAFWLQRGELGLEIGGSGAAAGAYTAVLRGLSSSPSLTGAPVELSLARQEGVAGPRGVSLSAVLDHTSEVVRDSATLSLAGLGLPSVDLTTFGGTLGLGEGAADFALTRIGDQIDATLRWSSTDLSWNRSGSAPAAGSVQIGSPEWGRELVWRTLTGLERVELSMGLSGNIESPSVSIASNLGEAVAASLRRELGAEIDAAEARLRAEVDERIQPLVQDARSRVEAARSEVLERISSQRAEVDALRTRLDERIAELTARIPGGGL